MNLLEEVRSGPDRYISNKGCLNQLPKYLTNFKNGAIITGNKSFNAFKNYYKNEIPYKHYVYDATASEENAKELSDNIKSADVILGIGGGAVIDTAKLVAKNLNAPLIVIPTIVSNCAPYASISAIYTPQHEFKKMGSFENSPYITLVDLEFLIKTPKQYFIAGIGDTLAKWYECEIILRNLPIEYKTATVKYGFAAARLCFDTLITDSYSAIKELEDGNSSHYFARVSDVIISIAGCVGGFACKYGRVAGAHAIHNGLSLLHNTHSVLHGNKVAYGILVQLSYTNDFSEVLMLLQFYREIGLPTSLTQLNLPNCTYKDLQCVAEFAAKPEETFNIIDKDITPQKILQAIKKLEEFVKKDEMR